MKILGKQYTGDCLQLPVPLEVNRSMLLNIKTKGQRVSALYWLQFWHKAIGRAIFLNRSNSRPVQELKKIESEYAMMIAALTDGLEPSSTNPS